MMERFLDSTEYSNHSLDAANAIEGELMHLFGSDGEFEDLIEDFATYSPFGGEDLHSYESIRPSISFNLGRLRNLG